MLLGRTEKTFEFGGIAPYDPKLLAGFRAQSYDIALPEAWTVGRGQIRDNARGYCEAHAKSGKGEHTRNMSLTANLDEEVWRYVLLPVYVTAYQFEGRTFQVMVNGQSGEVNGQKPVVWMRVYVVTGLIWSVVICSGTVSIPLTLVGVGLVGLIFTAVFLVFAIIGTMWLWNDAKSAEAV